MSDIIFFGAGKNLRANYKDWVKEVGKPVCIVDNNTALHYSKFANTDMEILPFFEALNKYPTADIYPTFIVRNIPLMEKWLLKNGVSEKQIKRFAVTKADLDPFKEFDYELKPKWCEFLGQCFVIDIRGWSYCCEANRQVFPSTGDLRVDIENYRDICREKIDQLRIGLLSSCAGCYRLRDDAPPNDYPKLSRFNISTGLPGGDTCNLKCGYCSYRDILDQRFICKNPTQTVYDLCNVIAEECSAEAYIDYASGEITVSPYRNDILALWKKMLWKGEIFTSGVIYNRDIYDLLLTGNVCLNISLDAGTRETYAKVKGVDCFDRVCDAVRRYTKSGNTITLKYILLYGINDNQKDIDSFIDFAASIGAKVLISIDHYKSWRTMRPSEMEMTLRFIRLAKEHQLRLECAASWFNVKDRDLIEKTMLFHENLHKCIIIYGAGKWAFNSLANWIEDGIIPVCFADADKNKHGKIFPHIYFDENHDSKKFDMNDAYEILPLDKAIERFPNYTIYIGVASYSVNSVKEYLIGKGIPANRIEYAPVYNIPTLDNIELFSISKKLKFASYTREIVINKDGLLYKIELFGKLFYIVNSYDCNTTANYITQDAFYELEDLRLFLNFLSENSIVFDIGANVGIYSTVAGTFRNNVTIHSFEPVPQTFEMLCATIAKNALSDKVTCNNLGLSNEVGEFKFYWNKEYPGASSLGHSQLFLDEEVQEISVKIDKLDLYVKQKNITQIDYMKIDVEGAEKLVVEGGLESIRKFKPIIQLEQEVAWAKRFDYYPDELIQLLREEGYNCYVAENGKLFEILKYSETPHYTNFYFIPQEKDNEFK